jgi:hypothetical protein
MTTAMPPLSHMLPWRVREQLLFYTKSIPRIKSFRTYVVYFHTQYIKTTAQNRTSDAEDVLQFLYSQDQRCTRENLVEI